MCGLRFLGTWVLEEGGQRLTVACFTCAPSRGAGQVCDGEGGGQVKCLTVEERVLYARLIVALADRDSLNIVAVYKAMGVRTKLNNPTVLEAWATILNDRDDAEVLEGFNFQVCVPFKFEVSEV